MPRVREVLHYFKFKPALSPPVSSLPAPHLSLPRISWLSCPARASLPGRIPPLKIFVSWLHPRAEFCFLAAKPGFWAGFGFKTLFLQPKF